KVSKALYLALEMLLLRGLFLHFHQLQSQLLLQSIESPDPAALTSNDGSINQQPFPVSWSSKSSGNHRRFVRLRRSRRGLFHFRLYCLEDHLGFVRCHPGRGFFRRASCVTCVRDLT